MVEPLKLLFAAALGAVIRFAVVVERYYWYLNKDKARRHTSQCEVHISALAADSRQSITGTRCVHPPLPTGGLTECVG